MDTTSTQGESGTVFFNSPKHQLGHLENNLLLSKILFTRSKYAKIILFTCKGIVTGGSFRSLSFNEHLLCKSDGHGSECSSKVIRSRGLQLQGNTAHGGCSSGENAALGGMQLEGNAIEGNAAQGDMQLEGEFSSMEMQLEGNAARG